MRMKSAQKNMKENINEKRNRTQSKNKWLDLYD